MIPESPVMEIFRDLDLATAQSSGLCLLHSPIPDPRLPWPTNSNYSPLYPPNSAA
jgi:hypothetical protein